MDHSGDEQTSIEGKKEVADLHRSRINGGSFEPDVHNGHKCNEQDEPDISQAQANVGESNDNQAELDNGKDEGGRKWRVHFTKKTSYWF